MDELVDLRAPVRAAVDALAETGVEFYLFGANAYNVWGNPRYTRDADFVIFIDPDRIGPLVDSLVRHCYSMDAGWAKDRLSRTSMLKAPFANLKSDFVIGQTEFETSAKARRKRVTYLGTPLDVASAEDVILHKLIAHRGQDLVDIENIVRRQAKNLDVSYLRKWAAWLTEETGYARIETTLERLLKKVAPPPRR